MIAASTSELRQFMDESSAPKVAAPRNDSRSNDSLSSIELVARATSGDEDARNALCRRYLPRLRRWAHGHLPKWADGVLSTEDVVQETLLRVLSRLDHFQPTHDGSFHAYLREALRNRILDERRKAQRRPVPEQLPENQLSGEPSPLEDAIGREGVARYERALAALNPLDRSTVIMRLEWGFSYVELAKELGLSNPDTARMRVRRAIVRMAKDLSNEQSR